MENQLETYDQMCRNTFRYIHTMEEAAESIRPLPSPDVYLEPDRIDRVFLEVLSPPE